MPPSLRYDSVKGCLPDLMMSAPFPLDSQESELMIQGERVILRPANLPFSLDEKEARYRWSQDEELQYWSGSIPSARSFDEFRRTLAERDWPSDGRRRSYAILYQSDQLIGMVSCYSIDWKLRTGELGVYIGERGLWGQGLGTDAVITLLVHLFSDLGLRRIFLNTYATNVRALRSYSKAGFRRIATRRRFRPSVGYYREVRMVMEREAFSRLHPSGEPTALTSAPLALFDGCPRNQSSSK